MVDDTVPISHPPYPTPTSEISKAASIPTAPQSNTHLGAKSGASLMKSLTTKGDEYGHGEATHYRASMDAHCRRLVSDTETAFNQNEARNTKAIKEVRAHCPAVTPEAEAMHAAAVWEAEAKYADTIREVETKCTATIREAEATCADCVHTLQQSHRKSMQNIEREAIEEEGHDQHSFLSTCGVALQACPPEACGVLLFPLQLLTRNMSLATLLLTTSQLAITMGEPIPNIPCSAGSAAPTPPTGTKWW